MYVAKVQNLSNNESTAPKAQQAPQWPRSWNLPMALHWADAIFATKWLGTSTILNQESTKICSCIKLSYTISCQFCSRIFLGFAALLYNSVFFLIVGSPIYSPSDEISGWLDIPACLYSENSAAANKTLDSLISAARISSYLNCLKSINDFSASARRISNRQV